MQGVWPREKGSSVSLVQQNSSLPSSIPINEEEVLKTLGLNPRDPKVQALILACRTYSLDPVLKHAVLISGNLYVTRDGLLHVAHQSGRLDGIVVDDEGHNDEEWWAKVSVYVKGQTHPYTYKGRYPKDGHQKKYGPEMAVKTAEVMALRRAFGVTGLPTVEEQWDKSDEIAAGGGEPTGAAAVTGTNEPGQSVAAPPPQPAAEDAIEVDSFIDPPDNPDAKHAGKALPGWLKALHARMGEVFPHAKKAEMDEYRRLLVKQVSGETKSSRDLTAEEREAFDELLTQIAEGSWHFASRVPEGYELRPGPGGGGQSERPADADAPSAALFDAGDGYPDGWAERTGPDKARATKAARAIDESVTCFEDIGSDLARQVAEQGA